MMNRRRVAWAATILSICVATVEGAPRADSSSQGLPADVRDEAFWAAPAVRGPDLDRLLEIPPAVKKAGPQFESNPRLHALLAQEERLATEPLHDALSGMTAPLSGSRDESSRSEAESLVGRELLAYLLKRSPMANKPDSIASEPQPAEFAATIAETSRRDVSIADPPALAMWLSFLLTCLVLNRWSGCFPEIRLRLWSWPNWEQARHHEPRPGPVVSPRPPRV